MQELNCCQNKFCEVIDRVAVDDFAKSGNLALQGISTHNGLGLELTVLCIFNLLCVLGMPTVLIRIIVDFSFDSNLFGFK